MAIDTYTNLQTSIAGWLHRDDLASVIPDFISLCEAAMQRELTTGEQETTVTLTLAQNASTITLPTDFQKVRRIRYLYGTIYYDLWPVALSPSYSDGTTPTPPRIISFQGNTLNFHNPAEQSYSIVIDYYAQFAPLSASVASNWILASHPDAYLYGSLLQSAPFLGTDNRIDLWQGAFSAVIDAINYEDFQKRNSQITMVSDVAWGGRANRRGSGWFL